MHETGGSRGRDSIHNVKEPRADRACLFATMLRQDSAVGNWAHRSDPRARFREQRKKSLMTQSVRHLFATAARQLIP
jgi:hypothetical protein